MQSFKARLRFKILLSFSSVFSSMCLTSLWCILFISDMVTESLPNFIEFIPSDPSELWYENYPDWAIYSIFGYVYRPHPDPFKTLGPFLYGVYQSFNQNTYLSLVSHEPKRALSLRCLWLHLLLIVSLDGSMRKLWFAHDGQDMDFEKLLTLINYHLCFLPLVVFCAFCCSSNFMSASYSARALSKL